MNENKRADLVPQNGGEGTKNIPLRKVCVKVYLAELEFIEWCKLAEEAGIRARGLKPFVQKPHGFTWERRANTKGLVKFIKNRLVPYWKDGEIARKFNEAQVRAQAEKLGLKIEK